MRHNRMLAVGATMLVLAGACSSGGGSKPTIKIGSDGFDEARVMAEVYAQALEANGYTIDRTSIGMGKRAVSAPALENGVIDLKPEYVGSGLASYQPGAQTSDPAANAAAFQAILSTKAPAASGQPAANGGITVLNYTPGQDTNAFVIRADTASTLHLTKMSDLAAVQGQLKFGLANDCATNPVCGAPGGALQGKYGLTADTIAGATPFDACSQPMADALKAGTIDVGELCSTQPDIIVNGWTLLVDDMQTQPADNIAPLVRNDYLAKVDKAAFEKILNDVSAKIDTATLGSLYKQVAVDKKDIAVVAKAWLQSAGFVK